MGKKRTASRFFRWIKSDLPDCDPSPVLLLGVTKIESPRPVTRSKQQQQQRPHTVFIETEIEKLQQEKIHDKKFQKKRNSLDLVDCSKREEFPKKNSSTFVNDTKRKVRFPCCIIDNENNNNNSNNGNKYKILDRFDKDNYHHQNSREQQKHKILSETDSDSGLSFNTLDQIEIQQQQQQQQTPLVVSNKSQLYEIKNHFERQKKLSGDEKLDNLKVYKKQNQISKFYINISTPTATATPTTLPPSQPTLINNNNNNFLNFDKIKKIKKSGGQDQQIVQDHQQAEKEFYDNFNIDENKKFIKIGQTSPKFCRKRDSVRNITTSAFDTTTQTTNTLPITTTPKSNNNNNNNPNANNNKTESSSTIIHYNIIEQQPKKTVFNEKKISLTNNELKLTTPKALITRFKTSSLSNNNNNQNNKNNKKIDSSLFNDKQKQQTSGETTTTKTTATSNCRIYAFIPKCTKGNDSESISDNRFIGEDDDDNYVEEKKGIKGRKDGGEHKETNNNFNFNNIKVNNNNKLVIKEINKMDRSMDSIGSCSLDVDADSTDFSDTSGSLNLVTPSSGKDFPREFTSRIQERCQIPTIQQPPIINLQTSPSGVQPQTLHQQQQTTTILDPNSGRVTTILSQLNEQEIITVKKPSYLNLACCVNGYSNLTTYDSKLRQNINRSREVSPIRPITQYTLQYNNRTDFNNYLGVPIQVPIINQKLNNSTINMMDSNNHQHRTTFMSNEKRLFTSQMLQQQQHNNDDDVDVVVNNSKDVTDNVSSKFYKTMTTTSSSSAKQSSFSTITSTIHTSSSTQQQQQQQMLSTKISGNHCIDATTPTKSFIQQRVERLYGADALAQGFYTNKRVTGDINVNGGDGNGNNNNCNLLNNGNGILSEKYINSQGINTNNIYLTNKIKTSTITNSSSTITSSSTTTTAQDLINGSDNNKLMENIENLENLKKQEQSLPVLRHLRPEFRAQLPISPKKSMNNLVPELTSSYKNVNKPIINNTQITTTIPTQIQTINNTIIKNGINESQTQQKNLLSTNNILLKNGIEEKNLNDSNSLVNGVVTETTNYNNNINNINNNLKLKDDHNKMIIIENNIITSSSPTSNGTKSAAAETTTNTNGVNNKNNVVNDDDLVTCEKDGNYFLIVLKRERDRLIGLAIKTEDDMKELLGTDVSEETIGYLRSAAGKARLLATQKMKQFEGLCHNNLNPTPGEKFPTTNQDLQGFWDMVMLQVVNVDSLFDELDVLKANNWKSPVIEKPPPPQGAKLIKRPISVKSTTTTQNGTTKKATSQSSIIAAQKREAQRKQLAELKRKNKMAINPSAAAAEGSEEIDKKKQQDDVDNIIQNNGVEFFIPDKTNGSS